MTFHQWYGSILLCFKFNVSCFSQELLSVKNKFRLSNVRKIVCICRMLLPNIGEFKDPFAALPIFVVVAAFGY